MQTGWNIQRKSYRKLPEQKLLNTKYWRVSVWLASLCGRCVRYFCMLCIFVWFMSMLIFCMCIMFCGYLCWIYASRATACNFSIHFQFAGITIKQVLCIGFIISAFCSNSDCVSNNINETEKIQCGWTWCRSEKVRDVLVFYGFGICCFSHSKECLTCSNMFDQWFQPNIPTAYHIAHIRQTIERRHVHNSLQ